MAKVVGSYKVAKQAVTVQVSNRHADPRYQRLRDAVQKSGGRDAVADRSGVGKTTLTQYMKDGDWKLSLLEKVATACSISISWLIDGETVSHTGTTEKEVASLGTEKKNSPSSFKENDEDRVSVRLVNVEASAGYGRLASNIEEYASVDLIRSALPSHVLSRLNHLLGVTVRGDSMQPTLYDNDIVFVDTQDTDIIPGCVYVLRRDTDFMVKRLTWSIMGDLVVSSDNARYPSETIDANRARALFEAGGSPVQIMGRVLWKTGTIGSL